MKKVLITFATMVSTVAYSQDVQCVANQFNCAFQPKPWIGQVEIRPISNLIEVCNNLMNANNKRVVACTTRISESRCIIYTKPDTSMALLGHELRHCSEGAWHE